MFCAKCGGQNADLNKFCVRCGTSLARSSESNPIAIQSNEPQAGHGPVEVPEVATEPTEKFCPKCARSYPLTQKFCNVDGTALEFPRPESSGSGKTTPKSDVTLDVELPPAVHSSLLEQSPPDVADAEYPTASPAPASLVSPEADALVCPKCDRSYPPTQKFCNVDGIALGPSRPSLEAPTEEAPLPNDGDLPQNENPEPPSPKAEDDRQSGSLSSPQVEVEAPDLRVASETRHVPVEAVDGEGLACPKCGQAFPAGVRFCDRDGATLVSKETAEAALTLAEQSPPSAPDLPPTLPQPEGSAWDQGWEEMDKRERKRPLLWIGLAVFAALLAGVSYAWQSGKLDQMLSAATGSGSTEGVGPTSGTSAGANTVPGLLGVYKAHLADQDIELVVSGDSPRPLASSEGVVTYRNVVNGGTCTSSLKPESSGGIGGDTSNAVKFRQTPISGKPACPEDIPVRIDISGQPTGDAGLVDTISVEWFSGSSKKVLMSGKLAREVGK